MREEICLPLTLVGFWVSLEHNIRNYVDNMNHLPLLSIILFHSDMFLLAVYGGEGEAKVEEVKGLTFRN